MTADPFRSVNLDIPYLAPDQAMKHVTVNEALRALDIIVQLRVSDKDVTAPPQTPEPGEAYIIGAPASGDWAGREAEIAAWIDGAWIYLAPQTGWQSYVADEGRYYAYDGNQWAPSGSDYVSLSETATQTIVSTLNISNHNPELRFTETDQSASSDKSSITQVNGMLRIRAEGGVRVSNYPNGALTSFQIETAAGMQDIWHAGNFATASDSVQFGQLGLGGAVADAVNVFSINAPAALFNHDGDDMRVAINKDAAGDVASLMFKTDNSVRAECGLVGDDDFVIKVSANGAAFTDALIVRNATGGLNMPNLPTSSTGLGSGDIWNDAGILKIVA